MRQALAPTIVQRGLTTRASDLDQAFGHGALAANLGRGTFAAIRRTLASYQRLHNPDAKMDMLQTLSKLVSQWMVEHKGKGATDMERRRMLEQLEHEISTELVSLSKGQADEKYLSSIQKPADPHALKGLTEMTRQDVIGGMGHNQRKQAAGRDLGLTDAEITAIQVFSSPGGDYGYINPATAANNVWFHENKTRERTAPAFQSAASDKELKSEGQLHGAMAIKGLSKLPVYQGDVYRGIGVAYRSDFNRDFKVGGTYKVPSIASASKKRSVAEQYAGTQHTSYAVLMVMHKAGGRDIKALSLASAEDEVTLPPGDYTIQSVERVDRFDRAEQTVHYCYVVHVTR